MTKTNQPTTPAEMLARKDEHTVAHKGTGQKKQESLELIIIPSEDFNKLDILKTTNWQYVAHISSFQNEDDIDEELKEIKKFFGGKT